MNSVKLEAEQGTVAPEEHSIGESIRREHSFESLQVEGKIPADLNGTLFRNGPGLYEIFGKAYRHMFEGDGAVSAVRLQDGKAWGALRVVQSEGLLHEKKKKRPIYGFNAPWWRRFSSLLRGKMKNTANTNVILWQKRLFALMEGGKPTELSLDDLSTLGETDLGVVPGSFSAHPHMVPTRKALYNFGFTYGRKTTLDLFELPMQGKPRCLVRIPMKHPVMLHDFMATENHMVFFVSPVKVNLVRALLALGPFDKLFEWDASAGTEIIVVPIDQPEQVKRFHVDPFFQFHFANGFERNGELIIDYVRYPDFGVMEALETKADSSEVRDDWGKLTRAVINLQTNGLSHEPMWDGNCEFPRIHPDYGARDYRYLWMTTEPKIRPDGSKEPNEIVRLNIETQESQRYTFSESETPSEPIFVPKDGATSEEDGYVLSLVYDAHSHSSHVMIMDSKDIEKKPLARIWFDQHIPTTFHGNWVPKGSF